MYNIHLFSVPVLWYDGIRNAVEHLFVVYILLEILFY